ncbi:hypothetical protein FOZ63_024006, partial [Perkinsus olseni]
LYGRLDPPIVYEPARPGDEECGVPYKLPTIGWERRFVAATEPSLPFLPREVIGLVEMRVPYEEPRYQEVISLIKSGMRDTRRNTTQVCHIAHLFVDESWKDDGVREKLLEEALADLYRERPEVAAAFTVEDSDDVDAMMLYVGADFARLEAARGKSEKARIRNSRPKLKFESAQEGDRIPGPKLMELFKPDYSFVASYEARRSKLSPTTGSEPLAAAGEGQDTSRATADVLIFGGKEATVRHSEKSSDRMFSSQRIAGGVEFFIPYPVGTEEAKLVIANIPKPKRSDPRLCYISWVFVEGSWRGIGVGTELLEKALADVKTKWPDTAAAFLSVDVRDTGAEALYRKLNFKELDYQSDPHSKLFAYYF